MTAGIPSLGLSHRISAFPLHTSPRGLTRVKESERIGNALPAEPNLSNKTKKKVLFPLYKQYIFEKALHIYGSDVVVYIYIIVIISFISIF